MWVSTFIKSAPWCQYPLTSLPSSSSSSSLLCLPVIMTAGLRSWGTLIFVSGKSASSRPVGRIGWGANLVAWASALWGMGAMIVVWWCYWAVVRVACY